MNLLDSPTLPAMAELAGTRYPGSVGFLVPWEDGFRPVTYSRWWEDCLRVASRLAQDGVRPGDRILLMMETRYEWLLCDLAILCCGAWTVPIYPNLPASQLTHPILDAGARTAIASRPELLARLLRAPEAAHRLLSLYLLDGAPPGNGTIPVTLLRPVLDGPVPEGAALAGLRERWMSLTAGDPATILYTSGTSAMPKGVLLTHDSILSNARMITAALPFGPTDRYLSILPLAHTLERTVHYTMIGSSATIAFGRGMDSTARDAAKIRPTVLLGVPRLFEQFIAAAREAARLKGRLASRAFGLAERAAVRRGGHGPAASRRPDGSLKPPRGINALWDRLVYRPLRERLGGGLRVLVSGGAPLGSYEACFFNGAGLPMLEGYGLTEAGPVVSVATPEAWRQGSVGRPLPGVQVRIDEDGEILVKSPSLMRGYHNLDAESRAALLSGWLRTGDLGALDRDGFLYITGRKKDLIVTSGGKNVSPSPIEDRLKASSFVQEAVVFGDRRPHLVGLIVPDRSRITSHLGLETNAVVERQALLAVVRKEIDRVNNEVAPHERIRNFDLLDEPPSIEAGTLTPTLKVRRAALEAQCADQIAALYDLRRR